MATEHTEAHCHPHVHPSKKWYQNPLILVCALTVLLFGSSFFISPLMPFKHAFLDYLHIIWLPVLLGFLIGGVIDRYIPNEYISKILAQRKKRTVLYAVGLGFLASACSHGVLALSMELHKKGASGPAVVSFLLASPWASLPITLLLIGFFHWKAFFIIGAAVFVAVVTGLIFLILEDQSWIEKNPNVAPVDSGFSIRRDIAQRMKGYSWSVKQFMDDFQAILKGSWHLAQMVMGWVLIGMVLASLASAFVPESFFDRFLGPTTAGLLMTMLIAAVLEVCSEGTAPLAFEIYRQTGAFGNVFAFLMGGVITDITEIGLIWSNLGKKTALWMIGVTLPQVVILGWLFFHKGPYTASQTRPSYGDDTHHPKKATRPALYDLSRCLDPCADQFEA